MLYAHYRLLKRDYSLNGRGKTIMRCNQIQDLDNTLDFDLM